jgi:lipid-binding SYLF domain-containing protein
MENPRNRGASFGFAAAVLALLAFATAAPPLAGQVAGWKPNKDSGKTVDKGLYDGALATVTAFRTQDPGMADFFDQAHSYVVFPTVGKGGVGIGGAFGKGILFHNGEVVGEASLTQLTIGLQWGGQAYSEIIFMQTEADTERFVEGNYEVSAQASAVAATLGASRDVSYKGGVAIFTLAKGGLMYEASIGGQKFKFEAKGAPGS